MRGGFALTYAQMMKPFEYILEAITKAGYAPRETNFHRFRSAASEFYDKTHHHYIEQKKKKAGASLKSYSREEQVSCYAHSQEVPNRSIEDGLAENDWDGWTLLTKKLALQPNLLVMIFLLQTQSF